MKNQNNLLTIKYLKKLFLFLNILVLLGCNSKPKTEQDQKPDLSNAPTEIKPPIIDIEKDFNNKKEFCLSEIAVDIEYIKLEKTPNSLVGGKKS